MIPSVRSWASRLAWVGSPDGSVAHHRLDASAEGDTGCSARAVPARHRHSQLDDDRRLMADKSPRQHQSKKSGKTMKEKRTEKKAKQVAKRPAK